MAAGAQKPTIFVVGGAGYIGSQATLDLVEQGYNPIIIDNFSMGNRDIAKTLSAPVREGNIGDKKFCEEIFKEFSPEAVMHFAAYAYVGESVKNPADYYNNNVVNALVLLDTMRKFKSNRIIFSSTCATYGEPKTVPISEDTPQDPINPYGRTKLMIEWAIKDYAHAYGMQYVLFRYFNAAGADPKGRIGERHNPETHLIPLAIEAAMGKRELTVFGDDYATPDGTCVRDYIHVADISQAHIKGVEYLKKGSASTVFNIGNGHGYSVKEVIQTIEKVSGKKVPHTIKERRPGDPPKLVAAADKLKSTLGWKPAYPELQAIVKTAWEWHSKDIKK